MPYSGGYIKTYYVWRRNDGYVGCTARDAGRADHLGDDFELLLETPDWEEARKAIEHHRAVDDRHEIAISHWNDEP